MATILFDSLVFGPVVSRRLGISLGLNLLPDDAKICNYDCVYCECGWSLHKEKHRLRYHTPAEVTSQLEEKLKQYRQNRNPIDTITFAGNGEPTLHPAFPEIMEIVIGLRDRYFPEADIAVLSNATRAHIPTIYAALQRADLNILKLDTGNEKTFHLLNRPPDGFTLNKLLENLALFKKGLIIQSLFVRGVVEGDYIDNTSPEEVDLLISRLVSLAPELTMIYSIERNTAAGTLEKVPAKELGQIADQVRKTGLNAEVY